jgi:hypothetical protein
MAMIRAVEKVEKRKSPLTGSTTPPAWQAWFRTRQAWFRTRQAWFRTRQAWFRTRQTGLRARQVGLWAAQNVSFEPEEITAPGR